MRNLRTFTVFASLAVGSATSALAGAGVVTTTVTPLQGNVTYSAPASGKIAALNTYVGYTVTVGSDPTNTNTINNVYFTGTTAATDPAELATFSSSVGITCTLDSTQTAVNCPIGQLRPGDTVSFVLFFNGPLQVINSVADAAGSDSLGFSGTTYYAEGTGGLQSPPQNSTVPWSTSPVLLGTINPDNVKSGVPKNGATLFTGNGGIPTSGNKSAMVSVVPTVTNLPYTTADLTVTRELAASAGDCQTQGHFVECPTYTVTIPGTFSASSPLTNTYRIDSSSLKMPANKILNSVLISYSGDGGATFAPVGACTNGAPNTNGVPCILSSQCYKNNVQPADLAGDCEWILINTRNGLTKFY
ncbi:MAG TPA: hypothetical protein VLE94_08805 [Burkholderiaceae bacterium]|nr:hypothetical protein [Burkholderiaceae bacterium]